MRMAPVRIPAACPAVAAILLLFVSQHCARGGSADDWAGARVSTTLERMQAFRHTVCDKCVLRGWDCGCMVGTEKPVFQVLGDYAEKYARVWRGALDTRDVSDSGELSWVVVRTSMGAGNQHLQLVSGFMFALALDRGLVVSWDSFIQYPFDSVPHLITLDEFKTARRYEDEARVVNLFRREDVEMIACGDVRGALAGYRVVELITDYTVHLPLLNPVFGPLLRETFQGVPFFFLSHYLWSGGAQRSQTVHLTRASPPTEGAGRPAPERDEAGDTLGGVLRTLRRRGGLFVGMHVRTDTNRPGFYHDNTLYLPDDEESFCSGGDMGGLWSMMTCLQTVIGELPPSQVTVLWATDNDELSRGLRDSVQEVASVVWIDHELSDRHDLACWDSGGATCSSSGLTDLELLGCADVIITSPGSTYSFMAHARALVQPHIGSFFGPEGTCLKAAGSEAGLYMRDTGAMHDECSKEGSTIRCESAREGCVSSMASHFELGRCMQSVVPCAGIETGVLDPYVADLRHSVLIQTWMARFGFCFDAPYTHVRMPACTDGASARRREAQWRLVDAASVHVRASGVVYHSEAGGRESLRAMGGFAGDQGGWEAPPGSMAAYAFDGPHEVWTVRLTTSVECDPEHADSFSVWYTRDGADPHNGHQTRDAATLLVKARWNVLEGAHHHQPGATELILSTGEKPGVTATGVKIWVDEVCGNRVSNVQIMAIPLAESPQEVGTSQSLGSRTQKSGTITWTSVAEKRKDRMQAFVESEAAGSTVRIVAPKEGSEVPRQVGEGGDAQVRLRVRVLRGAVARLLESEQAGAVFGAEGGPQRKLALVVWLDDAPLPVNLPLACESGTVGTELIEDTDPMEECEGWQWLAVSLGAHSVSVRLAVSRPGKQAELGDGDRAFFRVVPWTHVSGSWKPGESQVSGEGGSVEAGGEEGGNSSGRTIVLSTVSGNVMHLIYQVRAWRQWCRDDFEFVAVLNYSPARGGRFRIKEFDPEGVRAASKALGVRLVEVTFDVGGVENHQVLLEWVWHSLVLPHYAGNRVFVAVTESDVFPIDHFSIRSFLEDGQCAVGGKLLGSRDKDRCMPPLSSNPADENFASSLTPSYVHPGFSYFAMHRMPHPERWCFVSLIISLEGQERLLDTGGCSYLYLSRFQTSDNGHPSVPITPRHVSPSEAASIRAFYAGWANMVDAVDPVGFSSFIAQSPAYRDFDTDPVPAQDGGGVKACWLWEHLHDEAALARLPLDCSNLSQAPLRTAIQESFCAQQPHGNISLFEGGQPVGGPFVHVGCGSGWCGAYDSVALQTAKLARADAFLQYVQMLYGGECIHCDVARELKVVGMEIPSEPFLPGENSCH